MELSNRRLSREAFEAERASVMNTWPTGSEVDFAEGLRYQRSLPEHKRFSAALAAADRAGKTLFQPRAGVALLEEHIALLQYLQSQAFIPEYQVRFRLRANTVAIWDNRCTQHYAVQDFWPAVRNLERAGIIGDRPH